MSYSGPPGTPAVSSSSSSTVVDVGADPHSSASETTPLLFSTVARAMDPETGIIHSRRSSRSSISSVTSTHSASSRDSHDEPHFAGAEVVRDIIVGLSDGLTVPFALAAGLSSLGNARVVVTAGVAEIVAGGISMGLGGYLAGKSEIEHYEAERAREYCEISTMPEKEEQEIVDIFSPYGLDRKAVEPMLSLLKTDPDKWVDFMMKFELSLERPDSSRSWISAITIGLSYVMGGLVPLIPYMATDDTDRAFIVSIVSTLTVLLIFGYVKAVLLGITKPFTSAFQMMLIGACAAATAYGVAKLLPVEKEFLSALDWPRNRND